jgi:hypothetical protein
LIVRWKRVIIGKPSLARSMQAASVVSLKFVASYFGLSSRAGITNRRSFDFLRFAAVAQDDSIM